MNCFPCRQGGCRSVYSEVLKAVGLSGGALPSVAAGTLRARRSVSQPPRGQLAEPEAALRHRAYGHLCEVTQLTPEHLENLLKRGLTRELVHRNGYFSVERVLHHAERGMREWESICVPDITDGSLLSVPGFKGTKTGLVRFRPNRGKGIFIPCRDVNGRILSAQIRTDDPEQKYKWLQGGGSFAHVPLGYRPGTEVWITEGVLKADVATALGQPCIGIPGVGMWETALALLDQWKPVRVIIAFDADQHRKQQVQRQLQRFGKELLTREFKVMIATWPEKQGNGLDDLLHKGYQPDQVEAIKEVIDPYGVHKGNTYCPDTPRDLWRALSSVVRRIGNSFLSTAYRVWLAIFEGTHGQNVRVDMEELKRRTSLGRTALSATIRELEEEGILTVCRGTSGGKRWSVYTIPESFQPQLAFC